MEIDGTPVGSEHPPYFIAEAGVNHNGDVDRAKQLVDAAANAGADAVKFQSFSTDRLVTRDASKASYQRSNADKETQYEMLKRLELDRDTHETLIEYCSDAGITFLSTPFDSESAEMLASLGVAAIKVGSGELDNLPFLRQVATLGLPLIVSTGMSTMEEVNRAREAVRSTAPDGDVVFLHCTSSYPTPIEHANLRAMQTMDRTIPEPVGYSDHTLAVETPGFAVVAGACVVEKHFTLDKSLEGPDHQASLEPDDLRRAVDIAGDAERALGNPEKAPAPVERETRSVARKSLRAANELAAETLLTRDALAITRPADGLSPRHLEAVVGARLTKNLPAGAPLTPDVLDTDVPMDERGEDRD